MSDTAFAVDIGETYVKIADVEKKKNKYTAKSLACGEITTNIYNSGGIKDLEVNSSLLQKLIKDADIKKKNVNIVIPDGRSYSQIIEMPILTEKELASAIKYQADQFIPLPIEKISLDLQILLEDKKNKKMKILLVAAENIIIDKITKIVEMAGLLPDSIENETSPSLRFLSDMSLMQSQEKRSTYAIFINFGYYSTSLFLYDFSINLPLEIHSFSLGLNIFSKEIKANFNLSQEEINNLLLKVGFSTEKSSYNLNEILSAGLKEFVSEIERFIISTKNKLNLTINDVFIFGEGFKVNSLAEKLSTLLGLKVKVFDIYSYLTSNNAVEFIKNDLSLFIPSIGANLR
jgi:type IV pilus assembly protein PilM